MKKRLLILICSIFCAVSSFAMPGFTSYLPDSSGQYVYYRDYSFERESYVGILRYDDSTFQIRYFAPKSEEKLLPEKEIALLLTVDPESSFWDMTGERIISTITPDPDDVEILNYLHDILYEFSARRIRLGDLSPDDEAYTFGNEFWSNGYTSSQDYQQFGGLVTIYFDCVVPLFNIKKIVAPDGSVALECCVIGDLKSNSDKSFEMFKGFIEYNAEEDSTNAKKYKKAKSVKHSYNNRTITVDKQWKIDEETQSFCFLNDDAVILMTQVPRFFNNQKLNDIYALRGYLTSVYYSYKDLKNCEILYDSKLDKYKIVTESFQMKGLGEYNYIYSVDYLVRNAETGFDSIELNMYKKIYTTNSAYFDKIMKTYK